MLNELRNEAAQQGLTRGRVAAQMPVFLSAARHNREGFWLSIWVFVGGLDVVGD